MNAKVDIEGSELNSISEWISSGILDRVSQIGMELHTGKSFIAEDQTVSQLSRLTDNLRELLSMGFMLISSTNNDCMAKMDDPEHRFHTYVEIVLYKKK